MRCRKGGKGTQPERTVCGTAERAHGPVGSRSVNVSKKVDLAGSINQ